MTAQPAHVVPSLAHVWLTTGEAAAYCRMSTTHLRRYATSGRLEGEQLVRGGRWRFHIDQLDAFLRSHRPPRGR